MPVPEEEKEIEVEGNEEFDAAFAESAEKSVNADPDQEAPGEVGAEDEGEEENVFDETFDSAAAEPAAAEEETEEDLASKLEATQAKLEKLEQSERSQRGRVSALTKKLVEQRAADNQPPTGDQDITAEDSEADADEDDDWEEFQREFPEMAAIVDKRLSKVSNKTDQVARRVEKVSATQDTMVDSEIVAYKAEQFDILKDSHQDADEIKVSQEFQQWRSNAPEDIQAKIKSHNAEDAASVLDSFKEETGWGSKQPAKTGKSEVELINERREKALNNSAGISSKKVGHSSRQDTGSDDDFDAAFAEGARKKDKERSRIR